MDVESAEFVDKHIIVDAELLVSRSNGITILAFSFPHLCEGFSTA